MCNLVGYTLINMETIRELKEICQPHRTNLPKSKDWGYLKHRELSVYITKAILELTGGKIKPNHLSLFNILFGFILLSSIALGTEDRPLFLILLFLFYFSFLLDKVDGEIARYRSIVTLRGTYLDEIYHLFVQNGLILAIAINHSLIYLGMVGFFLFFLTRYLNKLRYSIYAKYKPERNKFSMKKNLNKAEKLLVSFLNIPPLKLCSVARRHDIFLFLAFLLSIFCFNSTTVWFWFLLLWAAMLTINVLRFLLINYFYIDRDVQLVDENKL